MLNNKKFNVDSDDTIIIDGVRYKDTPGLDELIFKKILNDALIFIKIPNGVNAVYTENDKQTYRYILLTTNIHI